MRLQKLSPFDIVNVLLMLTLIIVTVYPLYYMAIVSVSSGISVQRGDVFLYPIEFSMKAYGIVMDDPAILRSYMNTLLYTSLGVVVNLLMTTLCAYPLSKRYLYGRPLFAFFVVFTMFFDGGLIPRYTVVHSLGMVNTIWALLIPTAINVFNMILMRTFFEEIPEALYESATVDGAGEIKTLWKIVLPLSLPVMATMFIFYAVAHWNSFFPALIYLNDKSLFPLQILVRNIVIQGELTSQAAETGSSEGITMMAQNIKYAVVFVVILPILLIYPFVQKYFIQGAMLGAVKG
ncbi:putative aldouronate transport system permease protein [Paenibacillus sp. 1_12]|uniref:carbohydrate ABC transporter permease n=1 Tax=Paenibacillus sp. 1_12 TaxID=1566278 RepID=UPI0008E7CC88|nr:carbohydrate ABC transporter permease [Paenibacillus sp. 1_12]SFL21839.1 putative aldouronate transport system permease protein [Paenibacillus sp. 1_12]